jgi:hypothetical protein
VVPAWALQFYGACDTCSSCKDVRGVTLGGILCIGCGYSHPVAVTFQNIVCSVKKKLDFSTSGQWEVVTECEGEKEVDVFDDVMVCTGHHTDAHLPLESSPGE